MGANAKLTPGTNDMATTHPKLAAEWHPQLNKPLTPESVSAGTGKSIWWRCTNDSRHVWPARAINRFNGAGCPFCSGRRPLPGVNDFETLYPNLAREWHPTRNGSKLPSEFLPNSHKKVWWQCSKVKKHEWETSVGHRLRTNCPYCANRQISQGENDLASVDKGLARQWNLEKNKPLKASEVPAGSQKVVWWTCMDFGHEWEASVVSRHRGNGCPYCANKKLLQGFNDLRTTHPNLASEWDFNKNETINPEDVMRGSNVKVWWICKSDSTHSWFASIAPRASKGVGCPVCANLQILVGFNDFATTNPGLAAEWHAQKNGDLKPSDVVSGSHRVVWWQCINFPAHKWKAGIKNRMSGTGCPDCTQYGYRTTVGGLFYFIKNDALRAFKVGITNPTAKRQRVFDFQKMGWEVVATWEDEDGLVILNLETKILQWIRRDLKLPPFLQPKDMGRHGGWSETFSGAGVEVSQCISKINEELATVRSANKQNV